MGERREGSREYKSLGWRGHLQQPGDTSRALGHLKISSSLKTVTVATRSLHIQQQAQASQDALLPDYQDLEETMCRREDPNLNLQHTYLKSACLGWIPRTPPTSSQTCKWSLHFQMFQMLLIHPHIRNLVLLSMNQTDVQKRIKEKENLDYVLFQTKSSK